MKRALIVREKVGRLVQLLTEKRVTVTQRGAKAHVQYDPKTGLPSVVNIPFIPDDADETFLSAIEGFLDHEVAHVLFTNFEVLKKAKKLGIANLHNLVEDSYIERKMAETFAGSGINLRNTAEFFLNTYTSRKIKEEPENAVSYLMVPVIRALAGQSTWADYMSDKWHMVEDVVAKIRPYAEVALPKVSSSQEALDVALEIRRLMKEEKPESEDGPGEEGGDPPEDGERREPGDDPGEGEGDSEDSDEGDSEPGEGDESESDEGEDDGDDSTEKGESGLSGDEEGEGDEEGVGEGDGEGELPEGSDEDALEHTGSDDVADSLGGDRKSKSSWDEIEKALGEYDEDLAEELSKLAKNSFEGSDYRVWTTDLDKIEPFDLAKKVSGYDDGMLGRMQNEVDHMLGPLQKDLERAIEAKSRAVWSSGHRSGRMHAASLTRLQFGDDRIFRRKHESKTKDVAVELLIDCSGSMTGAKIKTAAYAAYALSATLDRLNMPHEVIGFTTETMLPHESRKEGIAYSRWKNLYMPIFKSFGERVSTEVKKRLAGLPYAYFLDENVDGECVQIAASRLAQRRETRKILIVLSDGQPACPGNPDELRAHLKRVVGEVERSGIDVLGLGILTEAPKAYYSKHVCVSNLADLPVAAIKEIKALLMK